ncbi:(Fe-S)-binding protein [Candidatus Zixiibacteriota bacterium]
MANTYPEPLKSLIDKCFRCGLCRAVCPVFSQVGREPAVARGKLQVVKAMLAEGGEPPEAAMYFLSRCMTCGLCQQICPADVQVRDAIIRARAELIRSLDAVPKEQSDRFPALDRWRRYLAVIRSAPHDPLPAILVLLSEVRGRETPPMPDVLASDEPPRVGELSDAAMRVGYFPGCEVTIIPGITGTVVRILEKGRVQVHLPGGTRCCGALFLEAGDLDAARQLGRENIAAFKGQNIEAIVVAEAGCARTLRRDYREILGLDEFSVPVYHISEFLADVLSGPMDFAPLPRRAFYLPSRAPGEAGDWSPQLLGRIPELELVDGAELDVCCGDSLFFSVLHPELFDRILEAKLAEVEDSGCNMIITDSSLCRMQIEWALNGRALNLEARHIAEVLAMSLGIGPNSSRALPRTARARKKC